MPEAKHPILTDRPADSDLLDFQPYINALAQLLTDPATGTPITVGVFGRWGSGKTSLMRLIQQQVRAGGHPSVWFNAWKYEREALALWRVLILRTLDALRPPPGEANPALVQELDRLEESVYRPVEWAELGEWTVNWARALESTGEFAADIALSLAPGGALLVNALRGLRAAIKGKAEVAPVVEAFQRETRAFRREQLRSIEQFVDGFEAVVQQHVVAHNKRLVVFVDDLDRCLPERTVEVLEAIKLFLDVPGCIFVLGVDPPKVQEGIRRRYQNSLAEGEGADYLEKIIQLPFLLPAIDPGSMLGFIAGLQVNFPHPNCGEVFARGLEPNPRQVKRAINIFLLLWKLVESRHLDLTPLRLAKVVVIQHSHADLYELLRLTPRYLADLEIYYQRRRKADEARQHGDPAAAEPPPLPPALEKFGSWPALQTLFTLFEADPDACFGYLTPTGLRSYVTLTGRAQADGRAAAPHYVFEPETVAIPAGEFIMGSTAAEVRQKLADENETPQHPVTLPAYRIGRFPVTNLEYKAFVAAADYQPPKHWPNGQLPETLADHPVVYVSWDDAVAYCRWLSEKTGQPYRLPTEAEWEKAARGAAGRRYPWGSQFEPGRCNSEEAGINATTPVGQFSPAGDSPFGCADMAGNVREWCSTVYEKYPYVAADGREDLDRMDVFRVLRGGAFNDLPQSVRCAFRFRDDPGDWGDNDSGFRVVLSPFFLK